jgi:hypothetical protein
MQLALSTLLTVAGHVLAAPSIFYMKTVNADSTVNCVILTENLISLRLLTEGQNVRCGLTRPCRTHVPIEI